MDASCLGWRNPDPHGTSYFKPIGEVSSRCKQDFIPPRQASSEERRQCAGHLPQPEPSILKFTPRKVLESVRMDVRVCAQRTYQHPYWPCLSLCILQFLYYTYRRCVCILYIYTVYIYRRVFIFAYVFILIFICMLFIYIYMILLLFYLYKDLFIYLFVYYVYLFVYLLVYCLSIYLRLSIYLMCVCLIYHQKFAYIYYRNCRCVRSDGQITTFLCPSIPSLQRFPPRRVSQTTAAYRTPSWLYTGVSACWGDCMFSRLDTVWNCWIAVARFWIFYHFWSSNYS